MEVAGRHYAERKAAGAALLHGAAAADPPAASPAGTSWRRSAASRSSAIRASPASAATASAADPAAHRLRAGVDLDADLTPLGLIARLEHQLDRLEAELLEQHRRREENERRLADYLPRQGQPFPSRPSSTTSSTPWQQLDAELAADEGERAAA